jgi:hypothetical protein
MGELYEFPEGKFVSKTTDTTIYELNCPQCGGLGWGIEVNAEEWEYFVCVRCRHCGFAVSMVEDEDDLSG